MTEFGLYCDKATIPALTESMFMISNVIGLFLISPIADVFGRKPGLMFCVALSTVGILLASFSTNIYVFLILFFVCGLGIGPYVPATYLMINESASEKLRQSGSAIMNAVRCSGQLVVGFMAALISDYWKLFMIYYVGLPFAASLPMMAAWMPETPKFLVSKNKFTQAKEILRSKIARANKKDLPDFKFQEEVIRSYSSDKEININGPFNDDLSDSSFGRPLDNAPSTSAPKLTKYNYLTLFKYKSLRKITIIVSLLFFLDNGLWFGTIFAVQYMRVSTEYMTTALSIAEGISCFVGAALFSRVERKPFLIWTHILCVISLLVTYVCDIPMSCSMDTPDCW